MLLRAEEIKNSSIEKGKEKKNEEKEYTMLHPYALRMFFLLAWLRHHIILHTLYWICSITFRGWRRNISTHLRYFA
jgi:hypothetical protein